MYTISLFPLNTVLFPGTPIYLHIFEPRYRLMIRRCLDEQQPFGVALIQQGEEAGGALAEPVQVGCTARISEAAPLPDGRMNLTALGDERFRILELDHSQPYLVGRVENLPLEGPCSLEISRGARRLEPQVRHYLQQATFGAPGETLDLAALELPEDPLQLIHIAASLLQIPLVEKQILLELPNAAGLLGEVERLYRRETALLQRRAGERRRRRTAWMN